MSVYTLAVRRPTVDAAGGGKIHTRMSLVLKFFHRRVVVGVLLGSRGRKAERRCVGVCRFYFFGIGVRGSCSSAWALSKRWREERGFE